MHKIKELLMDEIYQYEERAKKMNGGKLSAGDLETIHKLTDTIKNIDKIEMLEDGEYSNASDWMGEGRMYGVSYARGRKRDSMGRYSRDDGRGRYSRDGYSRDGYSRDGGIEHLMEKAEELLDSAEDERQKKAIHRFIKELESI